MFQKNGSSGAVSASSIASRPRRDDRQTIQRSATAAARNYGQGFSAP